MKLLLDQGLPRSTVGYLKGLGITAQHVGDLDMATAADELILKAAADSEAVVVTLDADFHALLAATRATTPSVIRIRIEGLKGDQLATILSLALATARDEISAGAAVSVMAGRIRVRSLPIGG